MGLMKSIFISLVVLVIVGVGGYFGYNAAYAMGETAGYDIGYPAGEETGYSSGKQDGYGEGYVSGKQDGYDEGYISGEQYGYDDGYSVGHEAGYSSGKADGYEEGKAVGYDEGVEDSLGHGYTLRDPIYAEAVAFLKQDKTDENEYVEDIYGVYVCSHFARDVCNNAEEAGLRCAFVELRYPDTGHSIIAFDTIDEGLVYFDAITDEKAKPVVGKRYYLCIEAKAGRQYIPPQDYDDTIMDILVIW